MNVLVVTVLFFALVVGWFALAFVPALREVRNGVDARALPIAADGRVSPAFFADRFRRVLTDRLAGPVQEVRASGQTLIGSIGHEERFVVLPVHHPQVHPDADGSLDAMVLGVGDLEIPERAAMLREIYCEGSLRTGPDALLRATLAERGIELGARTSSLRWMYSAGDLRAGVDCRLYGRACAAGRMQLGPGTAFEKLHATRIEFGEHDPSAFADRTHERRTLRAADLGGGVEEAGGRTRVAGDLELPDGAHFVGDLVVTGRLVIGEDVRIEGSVKARGIHTGDGVEIDGALISSADLRTGRCGLIHGPVLAEGNAELGSHCILGSQTRPTTLRGARVDVHAGCVVHGAVWTLDGGGEVRA